MDADEILTACHRLWTTDGRIDHRSPRYLDPTWPCYCD